MTIKELKKKTEKLETLLSQGLNNLDDMVRDPEIETVKEYYSNHYRLIKEIREGLDSLSNNNSKEYTKELLKKYKKQKEEFDNAELVNYAEYAMIEMIISDLEASPSISTDIEMKSLDPELIKPLNDFAKSKKEPTKERFPSTDIVSKIKEHMQEFFIRVYEFDGTQIDTGGILQQFLEFEKWLDTLSHGENK